MEVWLRLGHFFQSMHLPGQTHKHSERTVLEKGFCDRFKKE